MRLYDGCKEILKIHKFRRIVSYTGFYCFTALINYAYTSNTTRVGYSRADQFSAILPARTELLTGTAKLYKAAPGNYCGDQLNGAYCLNISSVKENHHMHIMRLLRSGELKYTRYRPASYYMTAILIPDACLNSILVLHPEQYMAYLVSYGQLDGSG